MGNTASFHESGQNCCVKISRRLSWSTKSVDTPSSTPHRSPFSLARIGRTDTESISSDDENNSMKLSEDQMRINLLATLLPLILESRGDDYAEEVESEVALDTLKVVNSIDQEELPRLISNNKNWLANLINTVEQLPISVSLATARADRPGFPLVYVNKAFETTTQHTRTEVIGHNFNHFLHASNQAGVDMIEQALTEEKPLLTTVLNTRNDGTEFYNLLSLCPIFDIDGIYCYVLGIQCELENKKPTLEELKMVSDLSARISQIPQKVRSPRHQQ